MHVLIYHALQQCQSNFCNQSIFFFKSRRPEWILLLQIRGKQLTIALIIVLMHTINSNITSAVYSGVFSLLFFFNTLYILIKGERTRIY